MGNQAKVSEQNGAPRAGPRALASDMGGLAHDVLTLAELQGQLLVADVQECSRRVLVPGLVMLGGVALGLSTIPFALAALALLLIQEFGISYAAGFLIAALAGAVLSALLAGIGWFQVRKGLAVLGRSQRELVRNLRWIKKVLERSRLTRGNSIDNSWRTVK
jgi:hypothetical protein